MKKEPIKTKGGYPREVYLARFEPMATDASTSRTERVRAAKMDSSKVRAEIDQWIAANNMVDHMAILPSSQAFNLLFIEADPVAQKLLPKAPHLLEFAPCNEVELNLL